MGLKRREEQGGGKGDALKDVEGVDEEGVEEGGDPAEIRNEAEGGGDEDKVEEDESAR